MSTTLQYTSVLPPKSIKFRTNEDGDMERLCRQCHEYKPVIEFQTGRASCKKCLHSPKIRKPKEKIVVTEKRCARCGEIKPVEQFYSNKRSRDGYACYCKQCNAANSTEWQARNPERTRQLQERWKKNNLERKRQTNNAARTKHRARFPEREKARVTVLKAIKDGTLVRQPCEHCGETQNVQAHHPDHSKPLEVDWLCMPCHKAEDLLLKYNKPSLLKKHRINHEAAA